MFENLTDIELIALHREGNIDAFDSIYKRYNKLIKKISRSYFLVGGDSDDVEQEGLLGLLRAVNTYDLSKNVPFSSFAAMCIDSSIKTAVRLSRGKNQTPLNDAEMISEKLALSIVSDPEADFIESETGKEFVDKIFDGLSDTERKILNMYISGYKYKEIADEVGTDNKSVDNALQRCRKKIMEKGIKWHI